MIVSVDHIIDGQVFPEAYEHGLVSVSIEAGNLSLTFYTEELKETGFKIIADGRWHSVKSVELPSQEVQDRIKARRVEQEQDTDRHPWGAAHGYGQNI